MSERFAEQDLPEFANQPRNLRIELPRRIANPECISIGDNVSIGPGALLIAQKRYPSAVMQHPQRPAPDAADAASPPMDSASARSAARPDRYSRCRRC